MLVTFASFGAHEAACGQTAPATPASASGTLQIGTVTVKTQPLFTEAEAAEGPIYRAFNAIHIPTPPKLVRSFLLFQEGEPYDPVKVAESERNLRALEFLKTAKIITGAPRDGRLDITVETQDALTTEPDVEVNHSGGFTSYNLEVTQKNLFGRGTELVVGDSRSTERRTQTVELSTPALFGPYWNADALYARSTDGGERKFSLERPLFSLSNRWSFSFSGDQLKQDRRLFELGRATSTFHQRHEEWKAELALSLGAPRERSLHRLLFGVDLLDDRFAAPAQETPPRVALPDQRHFHYVYVGYASIANDLVKLDYVNRDLRDEDFDLGRQFSARLGLALHSSINSIADRDGATMMRLAGQQGWRLGAESFLLSHLAYEARDENGLLVNQVASANLLFVRRLSQLWHQTLVARADFSRGWRLDRDLQFIADGQSGLRAYPVNAYAGDKRLLFNVEDRFFLGRELLQAFAPGAAIFFDCGGAQPQRTPLTIASLKSDVGAGLRLAIARVESFVLRLDAAYQLNRDPFGHRGWVLSIGTAQAF
ncbi:MAG TPA: hypothetical protein VHR45_06780 [Thermoanaerobaculia bacterium]|nr:hypothetical protein [Thermoanaerobaculia bacterium]